MGIAATVIAINKVFNCRQVDVTQQFSDVQHLALSGVTFGDTFIFFECGLYLRIGQGAELFIREQGQLVSKVGDVFRILLLLRLTEWFYICHVTAPSSIEVGCHTQESKKTHDIGNGGQHHGAGNGWVYVERLEALRQHGT